MSSPASVTSGVLQGTVLGPLLVLVDINDLPSRTTSSVHLFADGYLLYRVIEGYQDSEWLQSDLNQLQEWEKDWQRILTQTNANKSGLQLSLRSSSHPILYTAYLWKRQHKRSTSESPLTTNCLWTAMLIKSQRWPTRQQHFSAKICPAAQRT